MSIYKVSTGEGSSAYMHIVTANTHVRDSNGLTLINALGQQVAMFPTFNWMLVDEAEKKEAATTEPKATEEETTSSPAASGE